MCGLTASRSTEFIRYKEGSRLVNQDPYFQFLVKSLKSRSVMMSYLCRCILSIPLYWENNFGPHRLIHCIVTCDTGDKHLLTLGKNSQNDFFYMYFLQYMLIKVLNY